nr:PREDICTED: multimerin-1-like [Latimeria chalumnae]|eukprot:XP_014347236.1 PREDICTED: multimerin-1-like [Latimeria chalumnae]
MKSLILFAILLTLKVNCQKALPSISSILWTPPEDIRGTSGLNNNTGQQPSTEKLATNVSTFATQSPGGVPEDGRSKDVTNTENSTALENGSRYSDPGNSLNETFRKNSTLGSSQATSRLNGTVSSTNEVNGAGKLVPRNTPLESLPIVSRSPKQTYNSISPLKQRTYTNKPKFETARGKNWCAYVHTRLSPTVVIDNVETYVSVASSPCTWNTGGCPVRSLTTSLAREILTVMPKCGTSAIVKAGILPWILSWFDF